MPVRSIQASKQTRIIEISEDYIRTNSLYMQQKFKVLANETDSIVLTNLFNMAILPSTPENPRRPTPNSIATGLSLGNNKDFGNVLGRRQWLQRSPIRKGQTTPSVHTPMLGGLQSKRIPRSRRNQDRALELGALARISKSAKGLNACEAKNNFIQKEEDKDDTGEYETAWICPFLNKKNKLTI
jgi:hypothetical protein